jgi:FkbM family methyltransferase
MGPYALAEAEEFCRFLKQVRMRLSVSAVRTRTPPLVVDAGADAGLFSHVALALNFSALAIECRSDAAQMLSRRLPAPRGMVVHACLDSTPGAARLQRARDSSSMLPRMVRGVKAVEWKARRERLRWEAVPTLTLDALLSPRALYGLFGPAAPTHVAVIKMDLQGAEAQALRGARRVARQHSPLSFFLEKQPTPLNLDQLLGVRFGPVACKGNNCYASTGLAHSLSLTPSPGGPSRPGP